MNLIDRRLNEGELEALDILLGPVNNHLNEILGFQNHFSKR